MEERGLLSRLESELNDASGSGNLRAIPSVVFSGMYAEKNGVKMYNLSSNDYLGIAANTDLRKEFFEAEKYDSFLPTSSSSRLLTGNSEEYDKLEYALKSSYKTESSLVFCSGYHVNMGILPALSSQNTIILADKLVHASLIDGIRLSSGKYKRYHHNDYDHLKTLLEQSLNQNPKAEIIIVTESIFSMDGDTTNLHKLIELKKAFPNVTLYVDEAHAVGVRGDMGLGLAEEQGCLKDIDIIVGTFGKALASVGAFTVCNSIIREYLVNRMRTLIYTTALPPMNLKWTSFALNRVFKMQEERKLLLRYGKLLSDAVNPADATARSITHIVPWIIGSSRDTIERTNYLQKEQFYVLPIRPPTVPEGTSRIRFSLNAALPESCIRRLVDVIKSAEKVSSF